MKIAIIGGGAAGFFAAITAAQANPRAHISIFESTAKLLAKVAISGGGRCNVTHNCFDVKKLLAAYPRGAKELHGPLTKFQPHDTMQWFESRGVKLKAEADGRMFPVSDNSASIVNCLRDEAQKFGVKVFTKTKVTAIHRHKEQFILALGSNQQIFDRILIATGSAKPAYKIAESLGHTIIPPVPSLFTFNISDPRIEGLSGISIPNVKLTLVCSNNGRFQAEGPLLITHWGLSGPAILKLSAYAARELQHVNYQAKLYINCSDLNVDQTLKLLLEEKSNNSKQNIFNAKMFSLPRRSWHALLKYCGLTENDKWGEVSKQKLSSLAQELTAAEFKVQGKGVFKDEFVTCGGVKLAEVDFQTMQSKITSGVYFAGEILDIDAITGGFNFQAAWTTGWIAGKSMASKC